MSARGPIALGILAGGRGRRLGGADKALLQIHGVALLSRTLAVMAGHYAQTLLSYNGDPAGIDHCGARVVADLRAGFPGPLAGLEALLQATDSRWLLTVPVDLRDTPAGLAEALCSRAAGNAGLVVRDADGLQPLVALWPVAATRAALRQALDSGQNAAHLLVARLQMQIHDISPWRLGNLNTPSDFE